MHKGLGQDEMRGRQKIVQWTAIDWLGHLDGQRSDDRKYAILRM
jgi:hypothetical protein